jgi:hypothetical protein
VAHLDPKLPVWSGEATVGDADQNNTQLSNASLLMRSAGIAAAKPPALKQT